MEFIGVLAFSLIMNSITSMEPYYPFDYFTNEIKEKMQRFLFTIDKARPGVALHSIIYNDSISYVQNSYDYGIKYAFELNETYKSFYKDLTPKMKDQLILFLLKGYI